MNYLIKISLFTVMSIMPFSSYALLSCDQQIQSLSPIPKYLQGVTAVMSMDLYCRAYPNNDPKANPITWYIGDPKSLPYAIGRYSPNEVDETKKLDDDLLKSKQAFEAPSPSTND